MVLAFGLQLTSWNLQCFEQSLALDLKLTWSNGYGSFQTKVSPNTIHFYYDHHNTWMMDLSQQASNTLPFVCAHESYPILVIPRFQDLIQFPFIYGGQNHLNQHFESPTIQLGRLLYLSHRRKGVRQQRQRQLEWRASQREWLYHMHIVISKRNERICHIPN